VESGAKKVNVKLLHAQALLAQVSREIRKSERHDKEELRLELKKAILSIEKVFGILERKEA
jgi:hypothetical protein